MTNRRYNPRSDSKVTGKQTGQASESFKESSPSWPGLPGPSQPKSRSGGVPTKGPLGPFFVKREGL